jgi:prepilin-type N-terminal cleavage/methylation domain-containing protein
MKILMCKKIYSKQGFTLAEILVAVGILGVVMVGLLQVYIYCSVLAEAAGNKSVAMAEAQSKMEEIRNNDFESIVADYTSTCACADGSDNDGDTQTDYSGDAGCLSDFDDDESDPSENRSVCSGTFALTELSGTGTINMTMVYPSVCASQCDYELVQVEIIPSWQNKDGRSVSASLVSMMAKR